LRSAELGQSPVRSVGILRASGGSPGASFYRPRTERLEFEDFA
jgi:hypothetical protein